MSESTGTTNLEPVLISPVVGGKIRTWSEDETRLWSVDDPCGARRTVGTRSRSPYDPCRTTSSERLRFWIPRPRPSLCSRASLPRTALHLPHRSSSPRHRPPTADAWEDLESTLGVGRDLRCWTRRILARGTRRVGFPPRAELPLHDRRRIGTGQRSHGGHPRARGHRRLAGGSERTNRRFRFGTSLTGHHRGCRNLRGVSHRDLGRHTVGHQPHFRQTGRFRLISGADTRR